MNITKKKILANKNSTFLNLLNWFKVSQSKRGLAVLVITLAAMSCLMALNVNNQKYTALVGDIADNNVVATKDMVVEDPIATQERQKQTAKMQPGVFSLHQEAAASLRSKVQEIFTLLNQTSSNDLTDVKFVLEQRFHITVNTDTIKIWSEASFQHTIVSQVLPFAETRIRDGVIGDFREFLEYGGGIAIDNPAEGTTDVKPETSSILDLKGLESEVALFLKNELRFSQKMNLAAYNLLAPLTSPSLTLDREKTNEKARLASLEVRPVTYHVQKGETIVRQGERISYEQLLKINSLNQSSSGTFNLLRFSGSFLVGIIISIGLFVAPSARKGSDMSEKDLIFVSLLLFIFVALHKLLIIQGESAASQPLFATATLSYIFPVAGAAGLSALVFSARRYGVMGLLLAFYCTLIAKGGVDLFLFYFLSSMWNTWLVSRTQNRQEMLFTIVPLTIGLVVLWLGCAAFSELDDKLLRPTLGFVLLNGLFSLLLVFAISPILEITFRYTTRFRLMELMNLEQPLLQQLMMDAPGTYHHCLVVSNLVEAAAKSVGANSLLCKVAALYHDIGKLGQPDYFIENVLGRDNKHDKLAPSMSALILGSHVKRGVELAHEHKLGPEIIDIIRQHHGTGVMRYFYQKAADAANAVNADEHPDIADYSYPGPRPQSKEAAIVMLADAVEASSRTLNDPTPSRIQGHVENIVKKIFSEGQLDESSLTFRDLNRISDSFLRILTGIFHHRIEYPAANKST